MATFFDTHAHLDFPDFAGDLPAVIDRAIAAGISRILCIGTDENSSRRAIELASKFDPVYAVVGWHPCHVQDAPSDVRPLLRDLASQPKVVGLGETGLDHHHMNRQEAGLSAEQIGRLKQRQLEVFRHHMEVAAEAGLNCVVHQRDCLPEVIAELEPFSSRIRGVFHCFVNSVADMERIVGLGSIVSFTGILTFKNAQSVRDTLAATPFGKFMLETDCPYLAPVPYRGKRAEPAHVREIATVAAQVKSCGLEALSRATCETAMEFFPRMRK